METFSVLLALCVGNSLVTGEFHAQRPVMLPLICAWTNKWLNNGGAADLRRHRTLCDITVMNFYDSMIRNTVFVLIPLLVRISFLWCFVCYKKWFYECTEGSFEFGKTVTISPNYDICIFQQELVYLLIIISPPCRIYSSVNRVSIGSDNGLSPFWHQGIIWTNAEVVLIGPWGTTFNEIVIKIQQFSIKKICLKMLSGKWQPFCVGLNVLSN